MESLGTSQANRPWVRTICLSFIRRCHSTILRRRGGYLSPAPRLAYRSRQHGQPERREHVPASEKILDFDRSRVHLNVSRTRIYYTLPDQAVRRIRDARQYH